MEKVLTVKLVVPVLVIEIALLLLVIPIVPLTLIERLEGETLYEIWAEAGRDAKKSSAQPSNKVPTTRKDLAQAKWPMTGLVTEWK